MTKPAELSLGGATSLRETGLWSAAALVILLAHGAVGYAFHFMEPFRPAMDAEKQALTIDLEPIPMSAAQPVMPDQVEPEEPVDTVTPLDEPTEPTAEAPDTVTPDEVASEEPVAEQPEVAPEEPTPQDLVQDEPDAVQPELPEPEPEIVEATPVPVEPEVVLPDTPPPPESKPVVRTVEDKPVVKPVPKKPQRQKPKEPAKTAERKVTKPAANQQPAPSKPSTAPKSDTAAWNNKVKAAIARRASSVSTNTPGRVGLTIVVSASGAILSARVASSSGNPSLDSAALRAARGRVPAAPAGYPYAQGGFNITIRFD